MKKRLCQFVIVVFLLVFPATASAAEFNIHINLSRGEGGSANGELWYNGSVIWRVLLLPDGAKPAIVMPSGKTTIIVPEIKSGMFLVRVYNS